MRTTHKIFDRLTGRSVFDHNLRRNFGRSLFGRSVAIVAIAVLAVALTLLAAGFFVTENVYIASNAANLERSAQAMALLFPDTVMAGQQSGQQSEQQSGQLADFCAKLAQSSGFRVTIVSPSGEVIADSLSASSTMDNHGDRPEIIKALAGSVAWSRRYSATLQEWALYAAAPIYGGGSAGKAGRPVGALPVGALRLALPLPGLMRGLSGWKWVLALAAAAAVFVALLVSAFYIKMLSRPLSLLAQKALFYAKGAPPQQSDKGAGNSPSAQLPQEFGSLDKSLDSMAQALHEKTAEATALSRRYSSILDSAGEAIITLNNALVIVQANPAAQQLLQAVKDGQGSLVGRSIADASGSSALSSLAAASLASGESRTAEIPVYGTVEKTFQVTVAPLNDARQPGLVLAISDISMLKRLETMRKDFVANVSHELRTPIQLIRGFTETLQADSQHSETSAHYLEIIGRNALRMERIVADLLTLARLERDPCQWLSVEQCALDDIVQAALSTVSQQAAARSISVQTHYEENIVFRANPGLIEQALVNLMENALRYSPPSSVVRIEASVQDDRLRIHVIDKGPGIPGPDLERLFERFYRADKSRDRKSGGTGLGLAIVRHIALAHGGSVHVESWAGEGSTFTIELPLAGPLGSIRIIA